MAEDFIAGVHMDGAALGTGLLFDPHLKALPRDLKPHEPLASVDWQALQCLARAGAHRSADGDLYRG